MRRIVVFVATAVLLTGVAVAPSRAATPAPVIYAHRGGAGYAPENTMAAFDKTEGLFGNNGVWLEMDTQATKDNVLVVMHDDSVDRTTNCSGKVNALTYAQIAPCNAAAHFPGGWPDPVPVPTMEQVLIKARDNGWKLMVEIKDIPLEANFDVLGRKVAGLLVPMVHRLGFPVENLIVQSFWPPALVGVQKLDPRIKTLFLTSATLPSAPTGIGIPATLNVLYSFLAKFSIAAPDSTSKDFSKLTVTLAHTLGRQLITWTVDDAATFTKMRMWGADGVITNRPDIGYAAYA